MATASADAVTVLEGMPAPKRRRVALGQSTNHFLRSWAWKREHRRVFTVCFKNNILTTRS